MAPSYAHDGRGWRRATPTMAGDGAELRPRWQGMAPSYAHDGRGWRRATPAMAGDALASPHATQSRNKAHTAP